MRYEDEIDGGLIMLKNDFGIDVYFSGRRAKKD